MSLRTIPKSSNSKTGAIATTYRAGGRDCFGTCPADCALNPGAGTAAIDAAYMAAVYNAVPVNGIAFTYSHFDYTQLPKPTIGKTVFNYSADTIADAIAASRYGIPATLTVPEKTELAKKIDGVRFITCPAETGDTTCKDCGGGKPLCARDREYVIVFHAHGSTRGKVGTDERGGCYGAGGHVAIHWRGTVQLNQTPDHEKVKQFARSLPTGAIIRHHVVGDVGEEV